MSQWYLIVVSLVAMTGAVYLLGKCGCGRVRSMIVTIAVFVLIFLSSAYLVADHFTNAGFDESVVYHLRYGLDGAGFAEYAGVIVVSFVLVAGAVSAAFFTRNHTSRGEQGSKLSGAFGLPLLGLAAFVNPAVGGAFHILKMEVPGGSEQLSSSYVVPKVVADGPPLNVVYIYLESVERTYFDEGLFPGLVPGIKSLAREARDFSGLRSVYGTDWTMGGVTASQCGIPLVTPSHGNSMSGMDAFLPGAKCVGDLLKERGYSLNYLGGASLEFAGKGKFYKTHGFNSVQGKEELRDQAPNSGMSSWGLFDDTLFDLAYTKFVSLSETGTPFGLFMLTLDTHQPNGHPTPSCLGTVYRDGDNPMLNSVHCADKLVTAFVQRIRNSKYQSNTLVVVSSDHIGQPHAATAQLEKSERRNLFLVLSPQERVPAVIARAGSTLDVGPTFRIRLEACTSVLRD